jgi:hypothetical protein
MARPIPRAVPVTIATRAGAMVMLLRPWIATHQVQVATHCAHVYS